MRQIVNISLPPALAKEVDIEVKNGNYASKSEFFRDLLRAWRRAELLKELKASQREVTRGKGKVLKSLRDLR